MWSPHGEYPKISEPPASEHRQLNSCTDREEFAVNLLTPIIEDEVTLKTVIHMPTNEQMTWGVRNVLEEISDQAALA